MSNLIVKETKDQHGKFHSYDDDPAVVYRSGTMHWYRHGKRHREDGPAVINMYGDKFWYKDNFLHREDGPAVEYGDGEKEWWYNNRKCYFNEWVNLLPLSDEQKIEIILNYE